MACREPRHYRGAVLFSILLVATGAASGDSRAAAQLWPGEASGSPTEFSSSEGTLDAALDSMTLEIQKTLSARERRRVAVMPLTRLAGGVPELGQFLADKLTNRLFRNAGNFTVVDRFHLDEALSEVKLGYTGVQDPKTAQKLGRILGADAVVTGTLTKLDRKIDVTLRLLATESLDVLATADARLPRDETIDRLFDTDMPKSPGDSGPSAAKPARPGSVTAAAEATPLVKEPEGSYEDPKPVHTVGQPALLLLWNASTTTVFDYEIIHIRRSGEVSLAHLQVLPANRMVIRLSQGIRYNVILRPTTLDGVIGRPHANRDFVMPVAAPGEEGPDGHMYHIVIAID